MSDVNSQHDDGDEFNSPLVQQFARLDELQSKLFDAAIDEADPHNWPAHGTPVSQMSKNDRGDRYWCKKNAAATFTLINKIFSLNVFRSQYTRINGMQPSDQSAEKEFDEEIQAAEQEAMKQLEAFQKRKNIKLVT